MKTQFALHASEAKSNNTFRLVALESDATPSELRGIYSKIHAGTISDAGDVAFSASLSGSITGSAVLLQSDEGCRAILRSDQDAPGGGKYKAFGALDLTLLCTEGEPTKALLFHAELEESSASEGVFLWTTEGVEPIALAGTKSPRGHSYKSFSQLTIESLNSCVFKLAFIATMEDGTKSIIIKPSYAPAVEILAIGDKLGEEIVDNFVISRMGLSLSCVADMYHSKKKEHGTEVIVVHDGFILSGGTLKKGACFPALGQVRGILGPPSVNFQDGFVAVKFESETSGLAIRDVHGGSEVIAKTGDLAPGLLGQIIQSFGSPISSSGSVCSSVFASLFGVASSVRLSGGHTGVWVGVFEHKVPIKGEARLLIVEDNSLDKDQANIHACYPVKFTNNGALLLWGTINIGDLARQGLFVIDGLFRNVLCHLCPT